MRKFQCCFFLHDLHECIFKSNPKIKNYQYYENFDADRFDKGLRHGLRNMHSFNIGLPRVSKNISG